MLSKPMRNRICFAYLSLVACIAIGFLYRIVLKITLNVHFFHRTGPTSFSFIDYVAFYSAGKTVLSGARDQIYQFATQLEAYNRTVTESLGISANVDHIPLGQSVPWFFAMLAPFALMPLLVSYIVWSLAGIGLSGLSLWRLLKQNGYTTMFSALFLLCVAGSYPYEWLINDGQNSAFILAAFGLMLYSLFCGNDTAAGIGLALMTIKPQYAIFMMVPVVAMRRWRLLGSTVAVVTALVGFSALIFGVKTLVDYPALLHQTEKTDPAVFPTWMVSIRGPLSIVMDLDKALNISTIVYALGLLALILFWLKYAARASQTKVRIAMGITLMACLLTSPHTHIYDLVVFAAIAAIIPMRSFFETTGMPPAFVVWSRVMVLYPLISFGIYLLTEVKARGEIIAVSFFVLDCCLMALLIWLYRSADLLKKETSAQEAQET
ncbi:MAG: hypothetical protein C0507_09690 [Cyanobacteria bacterium PR.3.49]|nr:hypothetical protein [Cyanobacteria bacterium PR.3.49]